MSERVIRPAVPDDARGICAVHIRSWQRTYRGLIPDEILDGQDIEARTAQRRERLADPNPPGTLAWVVESDDLILGFLIMGPTRDDDLPEGTPEIYAIYVEPDLVGTGLGRVLMQTALAQLETDDAQEVVLWVLAENPISLPFYAKAGFVTDTRVPEVEFESFGRMRRRLVRRI